MRIAAVALLTLAIAAGCGGTDEQSAPTQPTITDTQPAPANSSREPAPPLSGETLGGETIALDDFRGRPVLINVWSSW